ncbi:protein hinderin [Diretmus argenteus]
MVFVPGVNRELKFRTGQGRASERLPTMRAKGGGESKAGTALSRGGKKRGPTLQNGPSVADTEAKGLIHPSVAIAMEHIPSPASGNFLPISQAMPETSRATSQACLKDLCPEDKHRIANLIQELARVSEEKEESVQRLKDEQETFERKINQLEQQNLLIVEERESLQQQYRECQELLGLYQQYLSQQQEKLNQSISHLSQPQEHSKVSCSKGVSSRLSTGKANGSAMDGSYLGLAATRAGQPEVNRRAGVRGATKAFSDHASLSSMTIDNCSSIESSTPTEELKLHISQKGGRSEPHSHYRCEHYPGTGCTTQLRRTTDPRLENSHHGSPTQHECDRLPSGEAMGPEAKEALTRPLLGHEGWEEKRHQLLLQKMQLEVERERLQTRLAEQEERLCRQNQQLCQSRLDYNRFQQATQADVGNSITRKGAPQSDGPSDHQLPFSECDSAEVYPVEQACREEVPQASADPLHNGIHVFEASQKTRRDMATSPVKPPANIHKATSDLIPRTPEARLESSLIELLEVFSPVSVPKQCKPSTQRHKMTHNAPQPIRRAARPYPQSPQQDLEESQILEEIFFIY